MESNDKISVIIPIYNAEKYLKRCVDSVLNQTYSNLEVVLVDDGSMDNSRKIIEGYVERDNRVHAVYKDNGGPNSARKAGIMQASGSYAMFVDADDYVDFKICEKLINACNEYSADIAGCGVKRFHRDGTTYDFKPARVGKMQGKEVAVNAINISDFFGINFMLSLWAYIFDIKIIKNIFSGFNEKIDLSEDVICMLLALWDSKIVYISDEPLYYHVTNQESITHDHTRRCYKSQRELYHYGQDEFYKRTVSSKMYTSLEQTIIANFLILGYMEAFGHLDYLFPFQNVKRNSRVVVYGAGKFGIEIVKYITETGNYELIRWVDKNYQTIYISGYQIEAPSSLIECHYDFIVVAAMNPNVAKQIIQALLEMNADRDKIRTIQTELISYNALPQGFFE